MTPTERRILQRAAETPRARLRMIAHGRKEREALVGLVRVGLVRVAGDPLRVVGVSLDAAHAAAAHTAPAPVHAPDDERAAVAAACRPFSATPGAAPRRPETTTRAPRTREPCPECGREITTGTPMTGHRRAHERRAARASGA